MPRKQFAPVPPEKAYDEHSQAMQAALQKQGFFTREIRDGIYLLTNGWYHVLVVPTDEGTIVVDAPPTMSPDSTPDKTCSKAWPPSPISRSATWSTAITTTTTLARRMCFPRA